MGKREYIRYTIFLPVLLSTCLTAPTTSPPKSPKYTSHQIGTENTSPADDFSVPKSTIILFAVLGGLLIIMLIIYFVLGLECANCFSTAKRTKQKKEEIKTRPDSTQYTKLEMVKKPDLLFDSDEEEEAKPIPKREPDGISTQSRRISRVETGSTQSINQVSTQGDLALGDSASVYLQRQGDTIRSRTSTEVSETMTTPTALRRTHQTDSVDMQTESSDQVDSRYPITAGRVRITISYLPSSEKLEVTVIRVEDIPEAIVRQERATMVEVHVAIFPRKQRFKTRPKPNKNAIFNETFSIRRLSQDAVFNCLLRFRLYGRVTGKDNFLGEATYSLKDLDIHDIDTNLWLTFAPREGLLSST